LAVNPTRLPIAQQLATRALLESGASERRAAKLSGLSRETVRAIKQAKNLDPDAVDRIKKSLSAKFYDVADRSLDHITDDKLEKAQPSQLIMTAGIATDKARLIEGKATQRTEYVDATDAQIQDEIARLEAEEAKLKANAIDVGFEEVDTTPDTQPAPETVNQEANGAD
jgi:hypothetical protein